jgi:CRP-like cAMP-binding protein
VGRIRIARHKRAVFVSRPIGRRKRVMLSSRDGLISRNRLLAALEPPDLALLSPALKVINHRQGDVLTEAGDPVEQIYFPLGGMISLLAVMENGNGVELATVGREGAVGVLAGLAGRIAAARAVVQVEGNFAQIATAQFQRALADSPSLRNFMARYNDVQMTLIHQVAGCNALHQVTTRLCRWLLQTRDKTESDILPLTHEFLSEMLGVQRSTVTVLARELQSAGLIHYRRGRIEIVDRPGLELKACSCYEIARRKIENLFVDAGK